MKTKCSFSVFTVLFAILFIQSCSAPKISISKNSSNKFKNTIGIWRNFMFNSDKPSVEFDFALKCIIDNMFIKKSYELTDCINNFAKVVELDSNGKTFLLNEASTYDSSKAPTVLNQAFQTKLFTFNNVPYIEVIISGKKYDFMIDTGCQASLISNDTILGLNAKSHKEKRTNLNDGHNNNVKIFGHTIEIKFSNDTVALTNDFLVIPEKNLSFNFFWFFGKSFDGILGWDYLRNFRMTIDYKNKLFTLENSPSAIEHKYEVFLNKNPIICNTVDTNDLKYYWFDSGATYTALLSSDTTAIFDDEHEFQTISGKTVSEKAQRIDSYKLKFGDYNFDIENAIVEFNPSARNISGNIGSDMFQNGRLIIDYTNGIFEYSE